MSSMVNLKATGLNTQPNQLDLPEGSLSAASNVVIDRDNVIEKRRGYKLYGDAFGSSTDRSKQLMQYRDQLIRHYSNVLQYDNGSGTFADFPGNFLEPETGIRIKSVAANNNFYFTSSTGVQKIAATSSDLSQAVISNAGGAKAIDISSMIKYNYTSSTGFLPVDSTVAYRAVWGIKDVNSNLILGTPSPRSELYNPITPTMIQDFMRLLQGLDNAAAVPGSQTLTDTDYEALLGIPVSSDATDLRANIISLATKLDEDIYAALPALNTAAYVAGPPQSINLSFSTDPGIIVGDTVKVSGVTPSTYNGIYTVSAISGSGPYIVTVPVTQDVGTYTSGGVVTKVKYQAINQPDELSAPQTSAQLRSIQTYMDNIILKLQTSPTSEINNSNLSAYIDPLGITTTSTVNMTVYIPQDVINAGVNQYFLQLYRSNIAVASGTTVLSDLVPDDEMKLVYEAFPTSSELSDGQMKFEDVTLDAFAGANLYTNEATGEGALQANEAPPYAKDIARFKNVIFYANTKTKQKKLLSLLGVSSMITDYNNSIVPKITITNGTQTVTYSFVTGLQEIIDITAVADVADSLNGTYFDLYSAEDATKYRFYYKTSGGADTPPSITTETLVKIYINTGDSDVTVAGKTRDAVNVYGLDFIAIDNTLPTFTVKTVGYGYTSDGSAGTTGFTLTVTQQGRGQSSITTPKQVLLSTSVSPATAVDETARSLVNIINRDSNSPVYAYYLSSANGVPGQFLLESKSLNSDTVYVLTNNSTTGASFNPDLSPTSSITAIGSTNPALITTSAPHGLVNGSIVIISSSTSPTSIDGEFAVTVVGANQFSIPVNLSAMTVGSYIAVYSKTSDVEASENDTKVNRIFYSKLDQPEAVPLVNYFDVGDSDKSILRIFPLRDSLFVFKEEGLYRISGEVAPFNLALFDSSCKLVAPDSLGVVANLIFGWTKQGIETVSESGASLVSRPIDTDILKLASNNYPGFKTATFGLGYESDKSYLVWTISKTTDTVAQLAYRYSTVTGAWTTYDKTNTCGIVKLLDDKVYLGAGDTNYTEQERKTFTRLDYADRELAFSINPGNYAANQIKFTSVTGFELGDVLVQEQTVTPFIFNMLLKKLDLDPGVPFTAFYTTYMAVGGNNMRNKIVELAQKLDTLSLSFTDYYSDIAAKTGSIGSQTIGGSVVQITSTGHGLITGRYINISGNTSTPSLNGNFLVTVIDANTFSVPAVVITPVSDGTFITLDDNFTDIQGCYNNIINKLNTDQTVAFSNYLENYSITTIEAIVTGINKITKTITLNLTLEYVIGPVTLFKSYTSTAVYSPVTMGDPLGYKHLREATIMFESKAFTNATLSFGSDLLPAYTPIVFMGDGNGIYGHSEFGSGFFGGASHGAPFRTLIPRNNQRCRYLNIKFEHDVARENVVVFGLTITGEAGYSTRAYRG